MRIALPYKDLVGDRNWRRWTLASATSRISVAAGPLALVLGGRYATGSFADGAVLAGIYAFAEAIAAPWQGRRLDRGDRRLKIALALAGGTAALAILELAVVTRAGMWALVPATALAAAIPAAVQGGLRAYLSEIVAPEQLKRAFALDASLLEVEWLSAPALIALVALLGAPYLGIALMLAASGLAIVFVVGLPAVSAIGTEQRPSRSVWRNKAALPSYAISAVLGYVEGTVTVAIAPLLVAVHSRAGLAGLVLVGLSIASAIGGFAFGAFERRLPDAPETNANILLLVLCSLTIPVALANSAVVVALAVAAFGFLIAPINGLRTHLLSEAVARSQRAQAFSIL